MRLGLNLKDLRCLSSCIVSRLGLIDTRMENLSEKLKKQSGALSLDEKRPDTVLGLVDIYYTGIKVYANCTHLIARKIL